MPGTRPAVDAEHEDMNYVVVMDFEGSAAAHPNTRVHTIKDYKGREYECALPALESTEETPIPRTSDVKALEEHMLEHHTPSQLLDSFGTKCFYRAEDWWTYEVCYHKSVRQFHNDPATGSLASEYLLGTYLEEQPADVDTVLTDVSTDSRKSTMYVREIYSDGGVCDVTGQPRSTEVRYTCAPDVSDGILSIREASTCEYVVTIAARALCMHAGFRVQEPPLSLITCRRLGEAAADAAEADS